MKTSQHTATIHTQSELREAYDTLAKAHQKLTLDYQYLQQQLSELKRLIFGSKSERFVATEDGQLELFTEVSSIISPLDNDTVEITYKREQYTKPKQQPVRTTLAAHLPRVEETIEPEGLPIGAKKIGEEITELLEYTPSNIYVRKIIRPKYVLPEAQNIVIGSLPSLPIPKGNAGAGLLAQILVNKFCYHLPFYRQRQIFKGQGVMLSEATLCGWFNATTRLLAPLYDCLEKQLLQSNYLQIDESPIKVQDFHKTKAKTKQGKGTLHMGYHWVHHAPVEGLVLFKYAPSRSKKVPETILQQYSGTIQTDGYSGYLNLTTKGSIKLLGCMAHARRYFEKALDQDASRASYVLEQIQKLYTIERKSKERGIPSTTRQRYRRRYAVPVLRALGIWLQKQAFVVLPKSAIGRAIAYTLKLWTKLVAYTDNGIYEIDNNRIENTIRPLALGRKNYLFAGSHKAAQKAAMLYSFFAMCKINNVAPYVWLKDVLERIPEHKANRLTELLPNHWKNFS
ncbi:IS66 family transposase [Aquimarina algicola]|uniref:IS66 family transposase n=1 Tax=Aquimarina algicola TaxID=2589995 RepID=UPI001CF5CD65|nr:IS66 family transposase [Aquimarina algicola]